MEVYKIRKVTLEDNRIFMIGVNQNRECIFGGFPMSYEDYKEDYIRGNNEMLNMNFKFKDEEGNKYAHLTDYEIEEDYIVKLEK